ncbi:hypothetical protein G6F22_017665 [Rhizopus arrhizus]|nr:hypothetical protein G6F22_017665 [Rhizopus arrhizus]
MGPGRKQVPKYLAPVDATLQVQPLSTGDLKHLEAQNIQGVQRAVYMFGDTQGVVRPLAKGGDLLDFGEQTWLVTAVLETWPDCITEDDLVDDLGAFADTLVECEVVRGQVNRVPTPKGSEYVIVTPMGVIGLSTPRTGYDDPTPTTGAGHGTRAVYRIAQPVRMRIPSRARTRAAAVLW